MKKIFFYTVLFATIFILNSCGGVIGNIEKYSFANVNPDSLKTALNKVYIKYPELIKNDTTLYGNNNGEDFYYILNKDEQKIIFVCSVVTDSTSNNNIELSLTTAAKWGETMKLAPKMSFFEKRKYRKLFEENILKKIREELD